MALISCYECRKEVSNRAWFCPHCGARSPGSLWHTHPLLTSLVLLIFLVTLCVVTISYVKYLR